MINAFIIFSGTLALAVNSLVLREISVSAVRSGRPGANHLQIQKSIVGFKIKGVRLPTH